MRTLQEKESMAREIREKRQKAESKLRALFIPYNGKLDKLKQLTVSPELINSSWNKHHLFIVEKDTVVYQHPNQKNVKTDYVRVIYDKDMYECILSKKYFDETK